MGCRKWVGVILILPLMFTVFFVLKWTLDAQVDSPLNWQSVAEARLELLPQLLIPLTIAVIVVWLIDSKGHTTVGSLLGFLIILGAYIILGFIVHAAIEECNRDNPLLLCGEGYMWLFFAWFVMFFVNEIALIGISDWIETRINKRRLSSTS